jgi:hypothetical protein
MNDVGEEERPLGRMDRLRGGGKDRGVAAHRISFLSFLLFSMLSGVIPRALRTAHRCSLLFHKFIC